MVLGGFTMSNQTGTVLSSRMYGDETITDLALASLMRIRGLAKSSRRR